MFNEAADGNIYNAVTVYLTSSVTGLQLIRFLQSCIGFCFFFLVKRHVKAGVTLRSTKYKPYRLIRVFFLATNLWNRAQP